jgi:hypothetical protein
MNENQKKTTDEYRNNYDNIFRKNNGDKVLPVLPTDEIEGRVQTSSDIEQKS